MVIERVCTEGFVNQTAWQIANEYEQLATDYFRVLKAEKFYRDMADTWRCLAEILDGANEDDSVSWDRWGICE